MLNLIALRVGTICLLRVTLTNGVLFTKGLIFLISKNVKITSPIKIQETNEFNSSQADYYFGPKGLRPG